MNKYYLILSCFIGILLGYGARSLTADHVTQTSLVSPSESENTIQSNTSDNSQQISAAISAVNNVVLNPIDPNGTSSQEIEDALDNQLVPGEDREKWRELLERGSDDEIHLISAYSDDLGPENEAERAVERERLEKIANEAEKYLPQVTDLEPKTIDSDE